MVLDQIGKNIFFAGLLGGIVGGLLGNFLVTSFFEVFKDKPRWVLIMIFMASLIFFFGYLFFLYNQIKPI